MTKEKLATKKVRIAFLAEGDFIDVNYSIKDILNKLTNASARGVGFFRISQSGKLMIIFTNNITTIHEQ